MPSPFETSSAETIPIIFVRPAAWDEISTQLTAAQRRFAAGSGFTAKAGTSALLPGDNGDVGTVLFGIEDDGAHYDPFRPGTLPTLLPAGAYRFANAPHDTRLAALAFALSSIAPPVSIR